MLLQIIILNYVNTGSCMCWVITKLQSPFLQDKEIHLRTLKHFPWHHARDPIKTRVSRVIVSRPKHNQEYCDSVHPEISSCEHSSVATQKWRSDDNKFTADAKKSQPVSQILTCTNSVFFLGLSNIQKIFK